MQKIAQGQSTCHTAADADVIVIITTLPLSQSSAPRCSPACFLGAYSEHQTRTYERTLPTMMPCRARVQCVLLYACIARHYSRLTFLVGTSFVLRTGPLDSEFIHSVRATNGYVLCSFCFVRTSMSRHFGTRKEGLESIAITIAASWGKGTKEMVQKCLQRQSLKGHFNVFGKNELK